MRGLIGCAVLGATMACAIGGCTSDGDTFVQYVVGASLPGNFPGAPSTTNNVASDGGAFSESGGVAFSTLAPRYFSSGINRTGIVLYTVNTGGNWWVYAHYFNGSTFTPPVALAGGNQDTSVLPKITDAAVLFLNRPGDSRNGDALIFWRQTDLDDFITNNIGANIRLYYSYFDSSLAGTAASGTNGRIRYGFDSIATAVDNSDDTGADVTCFGLFSDGLHGMGSFMGDGLAPGNQYGQGDTVSYAGVVLLQSSFANPSLQTAFYCRFDFSTGSLTAPAALAMDGSFTAGTDDVLDTIATYDSSVFCLYNDGTGSPAYQRLIWQPFNSSGGSANAFLSAGIKLTPGTATVNGLLTGLLPNWGGVIGPDEGLARVVGAFDVAHNGFVGNVDIFAFQLDPATGAAPSANDLVEIDADTTNSGANPQPCVINSISGVVNRTSEYAVIAWRQTRGNSAANNGVALWSRAIQLTPTGASSVPTLSTRTAGSGAQQIDSVTTGNSSTTDQVQQFKWQQDVFPGCGAIQSDRYAVTVAWQQDDASATDDRVHYRRLTFTPDTVGSNPSAPTLGTDRQLTPFNDAELANAGGTAAPGGWGSVFVVDAGGLGGSPGDVAVYYVQNINSTSPASFRAFQRIEGGTARAIGSLVSGGSNQECVELHVAQVSGNGDLTGNPNWAGSLHHIFLSEVRSGDPSATQGGPDLALRHRVYDKNDTDAVIENRFQPVVGSTSPPFTLDQPGLGSSSFPPGALASGNLNGALWLQGGHFWYTEYNSATRTWWTNSGVSKPELIDHDSDAYITGLGIGINAPIADPCDNLTRFIIFWMKPSSNESTTTPTLDRWFCRVRD